MLKRIRSYMAAALIPLLLVACKTEAPKPPGPKKPQAQQKAPSPADIVVKSADISASAEQKMRNPFQSYLALMSAEKGKVKGPLECCETSLFKVVAVVVTPNNSFALLQAPDSKRYIVRNGDVIGLRGGRIIRIEPRTVMVREYIKDDKGNVLSSGDIEMKIPSDKQ